MYGQVISSHESIRLADNQDLRFTLEHLHCLYGQVISSHESIRSADNQDLRSTFGHLHNSHEGAAWLMIRSLIRSLIIELSQIAVALKVTETILGYLDCINRDHLDIIVSCQFSKRLATFSMSACSVPRQLVLCSHNFPQP
jgi:hypothetical protein